MQGDNGAPGVNHCASFPHCPDTCMDMSARINRGSRNGEDLG